MAGEACPADGCETRSFKPGSWADRPRSGTAVSGVVLLNLNFQKFEGRLALKLRFYIFLFDGSLARKLRFHIFHFHFFEGSLARSGTAVSGVVLQHLNSQNLKPGEVRKLAGLG